MDEAGWNGAALARRATAVAAEQRTRLAFDRKTVSFWLAGRRPRPPVPAVVAETFSRALGRPITAAATGLVRPARSGVPDEADRAGTDPGRDTDSDVLGAFEHAPSGAARTYSLTLLDAPSWEGSAGISQGPADPRGPATVGPLSAGQVAAVERMARMFADNDAAFGGGYTRGPLAAYLGYTVAPLLHCGGPPRLRTRLFRVATQLAYQYAFMCFDDNEHALAQHYYRIALSLAKEAADPVSYAVTLRAMSVQAQALGHAGPAAHLAEAAAATGRHRATPSRYAFLLGQVAVAAAAGSDRTGSLAALSAAERHLEHASSGPSWHRGLSGPPGELMGDYHASALAHQEAVARFLLGDSEGAITAFQTSLRRRPVRERRSRAIVTARLAELQLKTGHLEQATSTWQAFLDDYPHLDSGRATSALRTMRARLRPYSDEAGVRQLLARSIVS